MNFTSTPPEWRSQAENSAADPLAEAAVEVRRIVALYPELTDFGFGVFNERRLSPEEREARFTRDRETMFEERSLLQFMAARAWLHGHGKRKAINKRGTSYGLKHVAGPELGYVTNGMFIAAAVSVGFQIERARVWRGGFTPNAWLNISNTAWRRRDGGRT